MGGYKRSMLDRAFDYYPVMKWRRRSGWGLNTGWRRSLGYKYRRSGVYRPMKRRYTRNTNIKKLRSRRRTAGYKKSLVTVFRKQLVLEPTAGVILFLTHTAESDFKAISEYQSLYDEYKILRVYDKFRVEKSARVENEEDDVDIVHWSAYDPDADGRTFTGLADFQKVVGSKWHIMKPYQVRTTTFSPNFPPDRRNDYGIKKVNNPWLDVGNTSTTASKNGVQHLFIGPAEQAASPKKYKIIVEQTIKVAFRGLRQGQAYA